MKKPQSQKFALGAHCWKTIFESLVGGEIQRWLGWDMKAATCAWPKSTSHAFAAVYGKTRQPLTPILSSVGSIQGKIYACWQKRTIKRPDTHINTTASTSTKTRSGYHCFLAGFIQLNIYTHTHTHSHTQWKEFWLELLHSGLHPAQHLHPHPNPRLHPPRPDLVIIVAQRIASSSTSTLISKPASTPTEKRSSYHCCLASGIQVPSSAQICLLSTESHQV